MKKDARLRKQHSVFRGDELDFASPDNFIVR